MADRRAVVLIAVVVVAVGAGSVVVFERGHPLSATTQSTVATGSALIVRTDLATTIQVNGTLGYAGSYLVANQASGTYTALPAPGQVITAGQSVYEVDGRAVVLLYGARPVWRALSVGVPDGPDVAQLKQNLVALGFGALRVDNHFDAAAAADVRRWQARLGVPVTGVVGMADVVFAPGPIRVDTVSASLGDPARPGTLLHTTGTSQIVNVAVPVAQEYLARVGDTVGVVLPDGSTTAPGTITSVSPVATAASQSNNGPAGPAAVNATVVLANPASVASFDQAPVTVNITDQSVRGVLAVPINALVALAGGGYGIYVLSGQRRTLLGVRTGLFSDTMVQVSGTGLAPGMSVEVPAS